MVDKGDLLDLDLLPFTFFKCHPEPYCFDKCIGDHRKVDKQNIMEIVGEKKCRHDPYKP